MLSRCATSLLIGLALTTTLCPVQGQEPEGIPAPAEPSTMRFAELSEKTLSNGLRVVAVPRPSLPIASVGVLIGTGSESDPANLAGLASFTANLLMRGTTTRSATQLADELEQLGASIEVTANWDQSLALLNTLTSNLTPAMEIVADVIRNPAFTNEEVERLRKEALDELQIVLQQPGQLARIAAARAILAESAYAHPTTGTPAALKRIKRTDVTAAHARDYRPGNTTLIVVGAIQPDEVFAIAEKLFGDWKSTEPRAEKDDPLTVASTPSAILVDMPTAGQAAVYIGTAAPRHGQAYYVGQVANGVLGGGYSSRLNREIRIKRGLSYGCGSRLSAWRGAGLFGAACQTKNESAAEVVQVIREELKRLSEELVPEAEFTARRHVLTGSFQRELETNEGYVRRIAEFIIHGHPADHFASALEQMNKVTPEQVREYAANRLAADSTSVIVVGRAKDCENKLRELFPKLKVIPEGKLDLDSANLAATARKK